MIAMPSSRKTRCVPESTRAGPAEGMPCLRQISAAAGTKSDLLLASM
ncbi:MAG TPA: hypothetical protein PLP78_01510 [Candidatus Fermentibacter daniensis]|nr:hypothetical protein [Candidatus Fermentibacter daniensis]